MFSKFLSPLEQFDSASFIEKTQLGEIKNLYSFYILESEHNLIPQLINSYSAISGFSFYEKSGWVWMLGLLFLDFGFSSKIIILFFGLAFSLFLPTAFDFLFTTCSTYENDITVNLNLIPQIHFFFFFDENIISFLLAFFFLGGSEEEDQDFLLEKEESDFIDDIVTPLFFANLGKDLVGNGELLVKVTSVFAFVLINNLMGMLPYSDTGTSSLMLTFWVALSIFVSLHTLMFAKQGINYFFSLFMPAGCPLPLLLLVIPLEFISYSFRLVSLSVRLFANMMAGHTLLKVIVGFSFTMILMGDSMLLVNIFPILVLFILTFLEVGVALIQSYIFTILTCIYLKDVFVSH